MATLSSLVHELRERIAASSSTPTSNADDHALETRFRAVLPNLLHAYVVPSPSGYLSLFKLGWLCVWFSRKFEKDYKIVNKPILSIISVTRCVY